MYIFFEHLEISATEEEKFRNVHISHTLVRMLTLFHKAAIHLHLLQLMRHLSYTLILLRYIMEDQFISSFCFPGL